MEVGQPVELRFLLVGGRPGQLNLLRVGVGKRVAEGVDADDGVLAGGLLHLVVHAFFLNLAALVSSAAEVIFVKSAAKLLICMEVRSFFERITYFP